MEKERIGRWNVRMKRIKEGKKGGQDERRKRTQEMKEGRSER